MNATAAVPRPQDAGARARFRFDRPAWARGTVTEEDARFIHDLILETRPPVALELGVASGCSSVVMLKALASGRDDAGVLLHAFDVMDRCYFDPQRQTGAAVAEVVPDLAARYRLTCGDALCAQRMVPHGTVAFAFVDANHFHPWPTLDVMALLPVLAPSAWVVLHDVRLTSMHLRSLRGNGPAYLFEAWPLEKRLGGNQGNTGAIRMPEAATSLDALWTQVLERPWETSPAPTVLEALGVVPREVAVAEMRVLRSVEQAARAGRSLCVWGTGKAARDLSAWLRARGVEPCALVDRDETLRATTIDGIRVLTPEDVRAQADSPSLVLVTGTFRRAIAGRLAAEGWQRGLDFVVL